LVTWAKEVAATAKTNKIVVITLIIVSFINPQITKED